MSVDWGKVEQVIATLADADSFRRALAELRVAFENADRRIKEAVKAEARVNGADKLMAEATAQLVKNQERAAELNQREAALAPKEKALDDREKQIVAREDAATRRERQVDQRHANLSEIAKRASA